MQKLIPQLFVAAIHYNSDYDRVSRSDIKIDEPLPKRQRLLYQNCDSKEDETNDVY
jgi:hypothetical protein